MTMKQRLSQLAFLLPAFFAVALPLTASAQQAAQPAAQEWKYKVKQLSRAEVDALLAHPETLTVLDVRRPDELTAKGGFPAYLNIQSRDVEKQLAYIPRDRVILTVSNHAHRAGAVGDLLAAKGYKVAGATGSEDYEQQGGKVVRIAPPAPKVAAQ
jgi:rhodanese-related sulfurtransferase